MSWSSYLEKVNRPPGADIRSVGGRRASYLKQPVSGGPSVEYICSTEVAILLKGVTKVAIHHTNQIGHKVNKTRNKE